MTDAATPTGPITRGSVARVGVATVLTALCGYTVLYLAARGLVDRIRVAGDRHRRAVDAVARTLDDLPAAS